MIVFKFRQILKNVLIRQIKLMMQN